MTLPEPHQPSLPPLPERVDVLVVGGGQSGLGTAYTLQRRVGASVAVLDADAAVGHSWGNRWDSLELFTPRRFSGLPGLRFPAGPGGYPTKDEMARYLQRYAARFSLPIRSGARVRSLRLASGGGFIAETDAGVVAADQAVIATGPYTDAHVPAAGAGLDPAVRQLHSSQYRRPADVPTRRVAVVGGGNSAAQLACELAATRDVTVISSRPPWFLPKTVAGASVYWYLYATGTLNADAEARVSKQVRRRGDPVIGTELRDHVRSGEIRLLPERVTGVDGNRLLLGDGTALPVETVLWCTGFRPAYGWLDIPGALDGQGRPAHARGEAAVPGLHWMGLPWQNRLNSGIIDGVDRDARLTADRVRAGLRARS